MCVSSSTMNVFFFNFEFFFGCSLGNTIGFFFQNLKFCVMRQSCFETLWYGPQKFITIDSVAWKKVEQIKKIIKPYKYRVRFT